MFKRENKSLIRAQRYQQVFNTPEGRFILNDLMNIHYMIRPSYAPGDSHESAFREGKRTVVLGILKELEVDPDHLRELMKEGDE